MNVMLRLVFKRLNGVKDTFSFRYADTSATPTQVKTLMTNILANKDIYAEQPAEIVGAEFYTTNSTPINLPA